MTGFWSRGKFYELYGTGGIDRQLADSYLASLELKANSGDITAIRELGWKLKRSWSDASADIERALFHNWHGVLEGDDESAYDLLSYAMRLLTIECNSSLTESLRTQLKNYLFIFPSSLDRPRINAAVEFLRALIMMDPQELTEIPTNNREETYQILSQVDFSAIRGYSELFLWWVISRDRYIYTKQVRILEECKKTFGTNISKFSDELLLLRRNWLNQVSKALLFFKTTGKCPGLMGEVQTMKGVQPSPSTDIFLDVLDEMLVANTELLPYSLQVNDKSISMNAENAGTELVQALDYRTSLLDDGDKLNSFCNSASREFMGLKKTGDGSGYIAAAGENFFKARADFFQSNKVKSFDEFLSINREERWIPPLYLYYLKTTGEILINMCEAVFDAKRTAIIFDALRYDIESDLLN